MLPLLAIFIVLEGQAFLEFLEAGLASGWRRKGNNKISSLLWILHRSLLWSL